MHVFDEAYSYYPPPDPRLALLNGLLLFRPPRGESLTAQANPPQDRNNRDVGTIGDHECALVPAPLADRPSQPPTHHRKLGRRSRPALPVA
jgi:hypothetical protein